MRRVNRFLRLSRAEQEIFFQAASSIVLLRLALPWFSLARVCLLVSRAMWRSHDVCAVDRIVWATKAAARFIPGSTCLTQALAAQALLVRYGYSPRLTIGVMKDERRSFVAHAWVTCEEQIMIGGPQVERYTSLLNLGSLP